MNNLLDRIIPRHAEMPGAGELGVAEHLDRIVGTSPELAKLFGEGLAQVEIVSSRLHSKEFGELTDDLKDAVLKQIESEAPGFFDLLVRHTYNGYYTNSRVIQLLGLESRPPQPRGYELEAGDLSGLERVRQRGRAYREVD